MQYYDFLSKKPCLKCGTHGVEIAHVESIISPKTGLEMPRSHKTLARYGTIPLCPSCHRTAQDSIHSVGEYAFQQLLGKTPCFVFKKIASYMAEFMEVGNGKA